MPLGRCCLREACSRWFSGKFPIVLRTSLIAPGTLPQYSSPRLDYPTAPGACVNGSFASGYRSVVREYKVPVEDSMMKFRILIADDHEVVRQGLRALLESHPGWEVCGEAADGWDVVAKSAELRPDVIAMDVGMPNLNGLDAAREILNSDPRQKILFLTVYDSEQVAQKAIESYTEIGRAHD